MVSRCIYMRYVQKIFRNTKVFPMPGCEPLGMKCLISVSIQCHLCEIKSHKVIPQTFICTITKSMSKLEKKTTTKKKVKLLIFFSKCKGSVKQNLKIFGSTTCNKFMLYKFASEIKKQHQNKLR